MKLIGAVSFLFLMGYLSYRYKQDFYETISMKDFLNQDKSKMGKEQSWFEKFKEDFNSPLEGSDVDEGGDEDGDDI